MSDAASYTSQFKHIQGQVSAFLSTLPSGKYPIHQPLRLPLPTPTRQYRHPQAWDEPRYEHPKTRGYRHETSDPKHAMLLERMHKTLQEAVSDFGIQKDVIGHRPFNGLDSSGSNTTYSVNLQKGRYREGLGKRRYRYQQHPKTVDPRGRQPMPDPPNQKGQSRQHQIRQPEGQQKDQSTQYDPPEPQRQQQSQKSGLVYKYQQLMQLHKRRGGSQYRSEKHRQGSDIHRAINILNKV